MDRYVLRPDGPPRAPPRTPKQNPSPCIFFLPPQPKLPAHILTASTDANHAAANDDDEEEEKEKEEEEEQEEDEEEEGRTEEEGEEEEENEAEGERHKEGVCTLFLIQTAPQIDNSNVTADSGDQPLRSHASSMLGGWALGFYNAPVHLWSGASYFEEPQSTRRLGHRYP